MKQYRVAVLGSGGREHALSWKLVQSPRVEKVWTLPGNGGIPDSVKLDPSDFPQLLSWSKSNFIDILVVGPEVLLAAGIVDAFRDSGIVVFGPDKHAAQLESSKSFAKEFMLRHGVRTAAYREFHGVRETDTIRDFVRELDGKAVIKFDGLAAGKGVIVCGSFAEASPAVADTFRAFGNDATLIIEERLEGIELSIIGVTDGASIQLFPAAQDHKRLLDNDLGPNTGGMGAYTPVKFCNDELLDIIRKTIIDPTLRGMKAEGFNYKGFLYFGILVQAGIPYLLEYNARLGDPETEVLLPKLKSDLFELLLASLEGTLENVKPEFHSGSVVDIVLTSGGYPEKYETGIPIAGLDSVPEDSLIFHAGTKTAADGNLVTSGGRVLNIVARGSDFASARDHAYKSLEAISFPGMHFRKDIGIKNI